MKNHLILLSSLAFSCMAHAASSQVWLGTATEAQRSSIEKVMKDGGWSLAWQSKEGYPFMAKLQATNSESGEESFAWVGASSASMRAKIEVLAKEAGLSVTWKSTENYPYMAKFKESAALGTPSKKSLTAPDTLKKIPLTALTPMTDVKAPPVAAVEASTIAKQKVVAAPPVAQVWEALAGSTLRQSLGIWAKKSGWQILWQSQADYPILASIQFSGTFESAIGQFLALYQGASKPLLAQVYAGQRLVRIIDSPENNGGAAQ